MARLQDAHEFVRQTRQYEESPLRIAYVSPFTEDHETLLGVASDLGCTIDCITTLAGLRRYLLQTSPSLIIFDVRVEDGTWKDILNRQTGTQGSPLLVVSSADADDCLWAEVLNLGGHEVIAKPFNKVEVRYLLVSAMMRNAYSRPRSSNTMHKGIPLVRVAGA